MPETSDAAREAFLAETRICVFTTFGKSGWPNSVPVWFEWDGSKARIFSYSGTLKLRNLERDPRATLLVFNHLEEPEYWVRIEGKVEIFTEGAANLLPSLVTLLAAPSFKGAHTAIEILIDNFPELLRKHILNHNSQDFKMESVFKYIIYRIIGLKYNKRYFEMA